MPTFGNIDGEEPSTVTFSVRTVVQAMGSTNEHMEILTIGDPESTTPIARVSSVAPKSTDAGLNVRIIGGPSTLTDFAVRAVLPSTAADNVVNINALPANSSLIQLNAIAAGYVSTAAPAAGSSGLNTWLVGGQLSSLSTGHVTVDTGSIQLSAIAPAYISTATPAGNSSGLNVWTVGGQLSSLSTGHVTVDTGSIRVVQSSFAELKGTFTPSSTDFASSAGFHFDGSGNLLISGGASATVVTVSALPLISSAVPAAGSSGLTVWLAGGNVSSLSTGHVTVDTGSIQVSAFAANLALPSVSSLSTGHVTVDTGSITLSAIAAAYISTANPAANSSGLVTWTAGGQLSSLSTGHVTVDTGVIRAQNYTSSGGAIDGSTDSPAQGVLALSIREAPSSIQTFAASTIGDNSTATVIVSSQANPIKVWSYIITSSVVAPSTVAFWSSVAQTLLLPMILGTGSSGITGAQMVSHPPHYLFRTAANNGLTFHTPSTGPQFHLFVSYST